MSVLIGSLAVYGAVNVVFWAVMTRFMIRGWKRRHRQRNTGKAVDNAR